MEIDLVFMLFFALGMIVQSLFMVGRVWEEENLKKIVNILATTLVFAFVLLMKCNSDCNEKVIFVVICLAGALFFTFSFRKQLIPTIGAHSVAVLSILTFYLIYIHWGFIGYLFLFLIPLFLLTIINCFSDIGKKFSLQVFFFVWFVTMLSFVSFISFFSGSLFEKISSDYGRGDFSGANIFLIGMFFMYLFVNLWYIFALIPIGFNRGDFAERILQIKSHMQLLAYAYIWREKSYLVNFVFITSSFLLITLQHIFNFLNETSFVALALFLLEVGSSLLNKNKKKRDGIGDIEKVKY